MRKAALTLVIGVAAIVAADVSPAMARQGNVTVGGRVIESGTDEPVEGATVELGYIATRETNDDGEFRFANVPSGRYVVRVTAIGYRTSEITLVAVRDTTLTVELEVAPVALDTLAVEGRSFTLKGVVKDAESGVGVIDVQVSIDRNRGDVTDPLGRWEIDDVPAGPLFALTARGFGYLPVTRELSIDGDTAVDLELEIDPVVQRMIDVQVGKLVERSRPQSTPIMPAITRTDLMRSINWTVRDVIETRYAEYVSRIQCIMIDDVQIQRILDVEGGLAQAGLMLPDRLERIEVLFRGKMLRIYSRDYIRRMMGGGVRLRTPRLIERMGMEPICI